MSHAHLRRLKAETQAAQPMARGVAQGVVWNELHERMVSMSVDSPTGASEDLYRSRERELRGLEDAFPAQPGQCGAVLALGATMCVDVVSRPDAFARLCPKIRAGYLLDALDYLDRPATPDVPGFLEQVDAAERASRPSASATTFACAPSASSARASSSTASSSSCRRSRARMRGGERSDGSRGPAGEHRADARSRFSPKIGQDS